MKNFTTNTERESLEHSVVKGTSSSNYSSQGSGNSVKEEVERPEESVVVNDNKETIIQVQQD